jgi:hypothetical protein
MSGSWFLSLRAGNPIIERGGEKRGSYREG